MSLTENRDLIQKADLALSDLTSAGALVPEQLSRYIKIAIKKNVLTQHVRVTTMSSTVQNLERMVWSSRVLHGASSGVPLTSAQRSKPTLGQNQLTAVALRAEVRMPLEVLEDQIERGMFQGSVIDMLGEKSGDDIEDILINGDTTSSDDALAVTDGLLKLATTNTSDGGVASLSASLLSKLQTALPDEFDDGSLMFFTNRKAVLDRRLEVAGLATALGSMVQSGGAAPELGYDGIPLVRVPRFPNNLNVAGGSNETNVLLMNPKNAILAFYRKARLDKEFQATPQTYTVVLSFRLAVNYEYEPAVARMYKVKGK